MTEQTPDRPAPADDSAASAAETIEDLQRQLIHWRAQALRGWAGEVSGGGLRGAEETQRSVIEAHRVAAEALAQLEAMRRSTSWRVTAPLRAVTDAIRARRGR